jgi:hypothetical protein
LFLFDKVRSPRIRQNLRIPKNRAHPTPPQREGLLEIRNAQRQPCQELPRLRCTAFPVPACGRANRIKRLAARLSRVSRRGFLPWRAKTYDGACSRRTSSCGILRPRTGGHQFTSSVILPPSAILQFPFGTISSSAVEFAQTNFIWNILDKMVQYPGTDSSYQHGEACPSGG